MGTDGHLIFDTKINESGFNSGITKLGSLAGKGLALVGKSIAAITAALGAGTIAGLKYNASIEAYTTSFEVMTGSAEKATEIIEKLKKFGAETPFELTDLADTTQLLMNYGLTADEAIDKMKMLGDISQGSADKMSRIATAYGQMSSAGKVSLEDIKQMIEAGFNPLQEISENTGESMASLYERISKGRISVDEITASMERATSEGGKYFQSMEKQSQTFDGLVSTMKDTALQLIGEVVGPISQSMTDILLPAAITTLEQLTEGFRSNGVAGMVEVAQEIMISFSTSLAENGYLIIAQGMETITKYLNSIRSNMPQILETATKVINTFLQGLVDNAPMVVMQAAEMLLAFIQVIGTLLASVAHAGLEVITSLLSGILSRAGEVPMEAATMVANFIVEIVDSFGAMIQAGANIIGNIVSGIQSRVSEVINQASSMISDFMAKFQNADWVSIGSNIIAGIVSGVKGAARSLVNAAAAAVDDALNWVKSKLGIASPSKVFRDEVGKYMAQGIGVGFEDNMPLETMDKSLSGAIKSLQNSAASITSKAPVTTNGIVRSVTNNYTGASMNYKTMKRIYKEAMNEANARPLTLDGRELARI